MKKCVLSAAVLALIVPAVYAMDEAEPAVEIEAPVVEVTIEPIEALPPEELTVELETLPVEEVTLEVSGPVLYVCDILPVDGEKIADGAVVDCPVGVEGVEFCFCPGGIGPVDENGNPIDELFIAGEGEVDPQLFQTIGPVEGVPIVLYSFSGGIEGGEEPLLGVPQPVEGEVVDPNLVELASQSGIVADGEVTVTSEDEITVRNDGEIQPHYRNLSAGPTDEVVLMAATGGNTDPTADAEPQFLNDEARSAVRGLRTEDESVKPKTGMGKLLAKFRKPKAEITQASHTEVDKTLANQMAQVDRMRDTALRTGDQKMLTKADALEKQIRAKAKVTTRSK